MAERGSCSCGKSISFLPLPHQESLDLRLVKAEEGLTKMLKLEKALLAGYMLYAEAPKMKGDVSAGSVSSLGLWASGTKRGPERKTVNDVLRLVLSLGHPCRMAYCRIVSSECKVVMYQNYDLGQPELAVAQCVPPGPSVLA
ncbi:hypothetical protein STEG23_003904 [Scotinomys teguina]